MRDCKFEDAVEHAFAQAHFPALRQLDVSCGRMNTGGPSDAALANLIAVSPTLTDLNAECTAASNATAVAIAAHSALEVVNLGRTFVEDAGALALGNSNTLVRLRVLELDRQFGFDAAYALASSSNPAVAVVGRYAVKRLCHWHPCWPAEPSGRRQSVHTAIENLGRSTENAVCALEAAGLWPTQTQGIERMFAWQRIVLCDYCNGSGWTSEGHCPFHMAPKEYPPEQDIRPNRIEDAEWVATFADTITAIEVQALRFLKAAGTWIGWQGARRIVWWIHGCPLPEGQRNRGPTELTDAYTTLDSPPHLDTEAWAHSCARAHETKISADAVVSAGRHAGRRFAELPDLFGPARCILDQGARIVRLDETGIAVEPATL